MSKTATTNNTGSPDEWEHYKDTPMDYKLKSMTKKMLATLRHGTPRRLMMCDYWAPITIAAQTLMGNMGQKV